jgi:hypothetical protein
MPRSKPSTAKPESEHPAQPQKVPISTRALQQRINRALPEGQIIRRTYGSGAQTLGDYYIVDSEKGYVVDDNIDLEELGRELGVLRDYEQLSQE